jgi:LPS export ABC transporter permease LptF
LDRYLLREMLLPLGVGLLTFVVMITGHMLFTVVDRIVEHGVGLGFVLRFVAYQVPFAAQLAFPAATLLATGLALNRLSAENEIVAIRAAGASRARIVLPVLGVGLCATVATLLLMQFAVPWANQRARSLMLTMVGQRPSLVFRSEQFTTVDGGLTLLAARVDQSRNELHNLYVFASMGQEAPTLFHAERASFGPRLIEVGPGRSYRLEPDGQGTWITTEGMEISLGELAAPGMLVAPGLRDMSLTRLQEEARRLAATSPGAARGYLVQLHFGISLAFSCLVFALVALPVTMRYARGESLVGLLYALVVVFLYYVVMLWLQVLAKGAHLPPLLAAWLENGVLLAVAVVLLWRQR